MKVTYFKTPEGKYKCDICGKEVKEFGQVGHNRVHNKEKSKLHEINKHIDTY